MRENPVFEIRERSLLSAVSYAIVGLILVIGIQVIIGMILFGTLETEFMISLIIILVIITLSCFLVAYNAFKIKTVRKDGKYFYYIHGNALKKRIALNNINKVRIGPFILHTPQASSLSQ